ncbi:pentatricopeptide repeat-containing protein CRR2, chloroplastic-like [Wolffia australiana]
MRWVHQSFSNLLRSARKLFDEMPQRSPHAWNILFYSYAQSSNPVQALDLLPSFLKGGFSPDHYTFPSLFKACVSAGHLRLGQSLHGQALKTALSGDAVVGCSLLDLYSKLGCFSESRQLFDEMPHRDIAACNAAISAMVRGKLVSDALRCFRKMQWGEIEADPMAVPSIVSACGVTGDLRTGKELHGKLLKSCHRIVSDVTIWNAVLVMYSRCGRQRDAYRVFAQMQTRNSVTWTALISCCGAHGEGERCVALLEEMVADGLAPNSVTFAAVLSGCSHAGLVADGQRIFRSMAAAHGVEPGPEHYACMADLLARAGDLTGALRLVEEMPMELPASIWGALLGSCITHNDTETAELAAERLFTLEPKNAANYVAYAAVVRSGQVVNQTRAMVTSLGLAKSPARSWVST